MLLFFFFFWTVQHTYKIGGNKLNTENTKNVLTINIYYIFLKTIIAFETLKQHSIHTTIFVGRLLPIRRIIRRLQIHKGRKYLRRSKYAWCWEQFCFAAWSNWLCCQIFWSALLSRYSYFSEWNSVDTSGTHGRRFLKPCM